MLFHILPIHLSCSYPCLPATISFSRLSNSLFSLSVSALFWLPGFDPSLFRSVCSSKKLFTAELKKVYDHATLGWEAAKGLLGHCQGRGGWLTTPLSSGAWLLIVSGTTPLFLTLSSIEFLTLLKLAPLKTPTTETRTWTFSRLKIYRPAAWGYNVHNSPQYKNIWCNEHNGNLKSVEPVWIKVYRGWY